MNFMNALTKQINEVLTENGDKAYATTGSYCLDFFGIVGGMRNNLKDCLNLFIKAYYENPIIAIKLLFYTRDIKGGLGERNIFRLLFNYLCNIEPLIAKQVLTYIPVYGRYDDLFCAMKTVLEPDVIKIIKEQLDKDIEDNKQGKPISLLAKWLPSVNTSSTEAKKLAKRLCKLLGYTEEEYRKILSMLRKGQIIENYLREKDYCFDYEKQPSQAMFKYAKAFCLNDQERYLKFIDDVAKGSKKLATSTLYPYQVVAAANPIDAMFKPKPSIEERKILDATWKSFDRKVYKTKTLVVRDGSGSMFSGKPCPIYVATSLAMIASEQLAEAFKDTFITFSEKPRLVKIEGNDFYEKVLKIFSEDEVANTDIEAVFNLILNTAINNHLSKEDMIERIVIISDMEFDQGTSGKSTYDDFKDKITAAGYDMIDVVYWNVAARNVHFPTTKKDNVTLVSGSSNKIFDMVATNNLVGPYEFMLSCLDKYKEFDKIIL